MSLRTLPDKLQAHTFFLIAAIILGIAYTIASPPLQAPDEFDHFRRVFHMSEGHFLPEKIDNRLGGDMPIEFKEFITPYRHSATNLKQTLSLETIKGSFDIPLVNKQKEFNDFPNTSYYSVVSYLPQVIAMTIVKQFSISIGTLFYSGRIFMYLFWLIVTYFLIRTVPVYKWLFTLLALLPMNIYISDSYSADTMTNILSFCFIILVLKYAFDDNPFTTRRLFFLVLICVLLALSKVVYVGLVLAFFIIPISKFVSKKHFVFSSFILLSCSLTVAYLWSKVIMHYYTPFHLYNPLFREVGCISHCADYAAQKAHILSHGTYFLKVIYHTLIDHPYSYSVSYIGTFGLFDIPVPTWLMNVSYAVIILVASFERTVKRFTFLQKSILLFSAFFSFCLLLLSQHLTWDCVGEGVVDLLQGRYLIPIFPLAFLFFNGFLTRIKMPVSILVIPIVFILSYYSVKRIYGRYFQDIYVAKKEFSCGAEEVIYKKFFKTTDSTIWLDGLDSRTDSVARTGKYSILLSAKSPFSFIFKFKNLCQGDLIEMSAWQKGTGAQFIIAGSGKKCGDFYYPFVDIKYKGADGWNRMDYVFTMNLACTPADSTQVGFFMWNPDKNTRTFIDDFKFSIKKFDHNYIDARVILIDPE